MKDKKDKDVYVQVITVIHQTTGWIEIRSMPEARADLVASQTDLARLTRYILPNRIIVYMEKKFLAELKSMMANDCVMLCNSISTIYQQVNSILERVH